MADLCAILALGLIVLFCLYLGAIALVLFALGAILYGVSLLPEQPLKGLLFIALGLGIGAIFGQDSRGPLR